MQIQVLLVACELGDLLREDSDVTLLVLLQDRKHQEIRDRMKDGEINQIVEQPP